MKKAVVIGAYGHIGSYMVPALYDAGYEVTVISRGIREPSTQQALQRLLFVVLQNYSINIMVTNPKFLSFLTRNLPL